MRVREYIICIEVLYDGSSWLWEIIIYYVACDPPKRFFWATKNHKFDRNLNVWTQTIKEPIRFYLFFVPSLPCPLPPSSFSRLCVPPRHSTRAFSAENYGSSTVKYLMLGAAVSKLVGGFWTSRLSALHRHCNSLDLGRNKFADKMTLSVTFFILGT